jgi:hypothetical protein
MTATLDNPQSTVTTQITKEISISNILIATTVRLYGNKKWKILYYQVIKKV